tara:strand:+ start:742 stop:1341 length:600 start_codon:yes stop_codon:yes gene_type:complete
MEAVRNAWYYDRRSMSKHPVRLRRRHDMVSWVVRHTPNMDEAFMAIWIIDRSQYPSNRDMWCAALFIAHKFHATVGQDRLSIFIRARQLHVSPARLKIDETRIGMRFKYAFHVACIEEHLDTVIKFCGGQLTARRHAKTALADVMCRVQSPRLPELVLATCRLALDRAGQHGAWHKLRTWAIGVQCMNVDVAQSLTYLY